FGAVEVGRGRICQVAAMIDDNAALIGDADGDDGQRVAVVVAVVGQNEQDVIRTVFEHLEGVVHRAFLRVGHAVAVAVLVQIVGDAVAIQVAAPFDAVGNTVIIAVDVLIIRHAVAVAIHVAALQAVGEAVAVAVAVALLLI